MVRRLNERDLLVVHEPAHGAREKVRRGDVVAVVDRDELARGELHRVVDVAGLGVVVFVALDVMNAGGLGKILYPISTAVVEDVDVDLVFRPVEVLGGEDRGFNDFKRLVVGRNENVDCGPSRAVGG